MSRETAAEREFVQFVAHRQHALLRTAYLLTGDRHLAEDLLQTSLTKTFLAWSRVEQSTAEAYVRSVLTRTYISWWRRKWRAERPTDDLVAAEAYGAVGRGSGAHGGQGDVADGVTERHVLWQAVCSLPPKQRAAVVLRFYEDLTEAQAAQALGCSVGTVKSQTSRALATLRTRVPADLRTDALGRGDLE